MLFIGRTSLTSTSVPEYFTKGKKRCKVLIINNVDFPNDKKREGAIVDEKNLKAMFKKFKFDVDCSRDLKYNVS